MPSGQQQRQDRGEPCPERVADKRYLTIPEHPPASRAQSAKRAYRLALDQEKRLRPSLEFYLMEAHIRRIKQLETRIYVFSVMITNKSDSVNSLRELNLFIEHGRKPGLLSNVSIPHDPELAQYLPKVLVIRYLFHVR